MLDAGFWILDIVNVIIFFFQHQASSIQYLRHSGINVRFQNFVFFGSGLSGLGISPEQCAWRSSFRLSEAKTLFLDPHLLLAPRAANPRWCRLQ
jgi:hypothetical protein